MRQLAPPSYTIAFGDLARSIWRHAAVQIPGTVMNGSITSQALAVEPKFLHERVVLTPESTWTETSNDVLSGHERVAGAIIRSWLDDNPFEVGDSLAEWIAENQKADLADLDWDKRWKAELATKPAITEALKRGPEELFERAGLTKFQCLAMRLLAQGKTPREIGFAVGITADAARSRIDDARQKILSLGRAENAAA